MPTWAGEPKKPINIVITPTALARLDALARSQGLSRSECIERYAREAPLSGETLVGRDGSPAGAEGSDESKVHASEPALRLSEERYRSLVEATSALVWTTGPGGEFSTPQPGWESFTGQRWPEYRNWGGMQALHPEDREPVGAAWRAASASGSPFGAEYRLWHALSGRYRYVQAQAVPLRDPSGIREWVGTVSDIDERVRREQTGRLLSELEAQMRGCTEVSELTRIVPEAIGRFLGVQRCSWGEWNIADGSVTIYPDYCEGVASIAGTYPLAAFGPDLVDPHKHGEAIVICDIETDPRAAKVLEIFKRLSIRAYVSVPVMVGGRCVSSFAVQAVGASRNWTAEEVVLLVEVARRLWLVVENLRLQAQTRAALTRERRSLSLAEDTLGRLEHLLGVSAGLSQAIDVEQIVDVLIKKGLVVLGGCTAFVARLDTYTNELEMLRGNDPGEDTVQAYRRFPLDAPLPLAQVVRTGQPLWLESADERIERFPHLNQVYAGSGASAWVSVPLVVEGRAVGGLSIGFAQGQSLLEADREYILALAAQCAQALERTRLYQLERAARAEAETARKEAEASEYRAAFLADVSAMLTTSLDYKAVLSELTRLAVPVLGDWCAVDILDDPGSLKRLAVAHVDQEKVRWAHELHTRFPPDPAATRGLFNVLRTGKSEWYAQIPDALLVSTARSPEHLDVLRQVGFSSVIIVPLSARGRTLGTVTLVAAESGRHYTEQDLRLAEDLAHRAALAVDNARLYSEAQQANRTKDQFLAVLSHELRTPLNPIIGWTQLLRRGKLDPATQQRALETIERNARLQNQLIQDLLDISRIVEGKFSFRPQPTVLSQVVLAAVEAVRHLAESSRVALEVAFAEAIPLVRVDPTRMQQVVWNLLTNAIKFTPTGGRVTVALTRPGAQVRLTVTDSGIGIPSNFLPHVFEQFRQADSTSTRKQGGLGLGLFIVRHIVELHGGTVEAHSDGEDLGATFSVELPVAPD